MSTKSSRRISLSAIGLTLVGIGLCATGFAGNYGLRPADDEATWWGIVAGIGFATTFIGVMKIWLDLSIAAMANDPGGANKRERLQAQRAWQLWTFPLIAVVLLAIAVDPLLAFLSTGTNGLKLSDVSRIAMPVLYAWIVPMIVMGWDAYSKQNRRFLDDELSQSLRARAVTTGFVVLMIGVTAAFGLGLLKPELGVAAMLFALTLGGVTTGIRFAWLYREAGRDA
ncbi:hypothetical protein [Brevundimonas sp.]